MDRIESGDRTKESKVFREPQATFEKSVTSISRLRPRNTPMPKEPCLTKEILLTQELSFSCMWFRRSMKEQVGLTQNGLGSSLKCKMFFSRWL